MASQTVDEYLTKQIYIEKNIVTFRSLSRAQGIHVNVAKNELANYIKNGSQKVYATYLISGVPREVDDEMDVDEQHDRNQEYAGGDYDVPQSRMILVGENGLESAKSQFDRINVIHVYSLSPSRITDAGHLRIPTVEVVREIDQKRGPEIAAVVGRVVGKHVIKNKLAKKVSKPTDNVAGPSRKVSAPPKIETKAKEPEKPADKPKQTGKLDFSKAKVKVKEEPKPEPKRAASSSTAGNKEKLKAKEEQKKPLPRGTKRKSASALMSDSEGEKEKPKAESSKGKAALVSESESERPKSKRSSPQPSRHKKVLVSSDEEDDGPRVHRRKNKALTKFENKLEEEVEKELQDMMDVDDTQVMKTRRAAPAYRKEEEEEEEEEEEPEAVKEDEDVDMDDPAPVQKKKRKAKKVTPVGRNGLKKKRVVKSKTSTDAKGFMVMEDYSEYESVDEEEQEPEPPKAKGKSKAKPALKKDDEGESTIAAAAAAAPSKPKPAAKAPVKSKSKSGQKDIASFFNKPK